MTAISLPKTVELAFKKATDHRKCMEQLARYLRTDDVLSALIEHRRQFSQASEGEYRTTLETLLSFYQAGEAVGVNELAKNTSAALNEVIENRDISQTAIRDSFIPLLRDIELIQGDGRLTWAYLDTPSAYARFVSKAHHMYTAYMAQTEHEAKLKHALRDATAQRKLEAVILSRRVLQDDIGNELDYLKRQDKKHREQAQELGIPYSQIKEKNMKKQKKNTLDMKAVAFPAVALSVILFGFVMSPESDHPNPLVEHAGTAEHYTPTQYPAAPSNPYGLSDGEYQWRQRYIALFIENNGGSSKAMEDELFDLAAEHMISRSQMEVIVNTITAGEVKQ